MRRKVQKLKKKSFGNSLPEKRNLATDE